MKAEKEEKKEATDKVLEEAESVSEEPVTQEAVSVGVFSEPERAIQLIQNIENDLRALKQLVGMDIQVENQVYRSAAVDDEEASAGFFITKPNEEDDGAINGIFDGERMIDEVGKIYQVPSNYASKSKLVEGDPLKLYITDDGKYLYKQVGPIPRRSVRGILRNEGNHYVVDADDAETYNILTASVTYFMSLYNLQPGDAVIILVPMGKQSRWAVIDNIA